MESSSIFLPKLRVTFLFETGDCARTMSVRRATDTPTEQHLFKSIFRGTNVNINWYTRWDTIMFTTWCQGDEYEFCKQTHGP
jgi:hypothetical protein